MIYLSLIRHRSSLIGRRTIGWRCLLRIGHPIKFGEERIHQCILLSFISIMKSTYIFKKQSIVFTIDLLWCSCWRVGWMRMMSIRWLNAVRTFYCACLYRWCFTSWMWWLTCQATWSISIHWLLFLGIIAICIGIVCLSIQTVSILSCRLLGVWGLCVK